MFHYVDLNEENKHKKKILKNLITSAQSDRGLGLTKPQAEKVDSILKSCEDIETQATIVLKSLDQSILKNVYHAQEGTHRLYVVIRQGLKALTSTTFRNIPKTDIQNLTDYQKSLESLYDAINERFGELNELLFEKGRTEEEYREKKTIPIRPPVRAEKLQEYLGKKSKKEQEYNVGLTKYRGRVQEELTKYMNEKDKKETAFDKTQELLTDYIERLAVIDELIEASNQQLDYYDRQFKSQQEELNDMEDRKGELADWEEKRFVNLQKIHQGLYDTITKEDTKREKLIIEAQEKSRLTQETLPNQLQQLEKEIENTNRNISSLGRTYRDIPMNVDETEPLNEEEYAMQSKLAQLTEVATKDFELVMKDFKIFITSLADGLIRFTSGLSGKLSKSQITNFRTPIESAELKLEGAGKFIGHYGYDHKRFL